jgi:hypothetical protein
MRCVLAQYFTVSKSLRWRSAVEERPPYQRESAVWSLDKQQLFIDSLLNGYDVPKIYLHDLRGIDPMKVYAIVDGKQRLTTIWRFLADEFALADDFKIEPRNLPDDLPEGAVAPTAGQRFSEFDPAWRDTLLNTFLSVVLIRHATEEDIEDLFSRLNNGEPLNAAEKRNAMGGDIARLIRELARDPFFADRLHFSNARHHHYELVTRLLLVEQAAPSLGDPIPDLRSAALDTFVRSNRRIGDDERAALAGRFGTRLAALSAIFRSSDPLLASPSAALVTYLFVRSRLERDGDAPAERLRGFFEWFQRARLAALERPEGEGGGGEYVEYSELSQHGTNEARNIARRLQIVETAYERYVAGVESGGDAAAGRDRAAQAART